MKILYHHRVGSRDGQAVHIDELVHAFRSLGHDVVVVAPPGFELSPIGHESRVAAWIKQRLPRVFFEALEASYNVPAYLRLRRALRELKPDFIYERHGLFLIAGTLLGKHHSIPVFLEVNSPLAHERAQFGGLTLARVANWLETWAWRNATHVLPVTKVLAEMIHAVGVPASRISVVANGVDPGRFPRDYGAEHAKAAIGLAGRTVLGFTGFMRSWHGLETVVEMLSQPEAPASLHLLLVGDGPAKPLLEQRAAELQVTNRVTFAGLVDRDRVASYVAAFDIALVPKVVAYASPLKLFEYMALEKAIVAPDQPNIREVLTPNVDAVLFDPSQPIEMARAVIRLAGDSRSRERLGKAARATIDARKFTWCANAERILGLAVQRSNASAEQQAGLHAEKTAIAGARSRGPGRRS